jgi:1,4-dihydroxy-2-naphthoate octaprenyltransferase
MIDSLRALRAPFLSGSLIPVLMAAAWAWPDPDFYWPNAVLALVGIACLHLASNLINDWADSRGSDPVNERFTPFSGGSRVIQQGRLSSGEVLCLSLVFYGLGILIGLFLARTHPYVLPIGIAGLGIGLFYSVGPFRLMSRGAGEIGIFFAFGPLVTLGAAYVMTGKLSLAAFLLGIPSGFLITAVIWINQFPDFPADRKSGKRNLVVRLGPDKARRIYPVLLWGGFISLIVLAAIGFSKGLLLGLLAAPIAFKASAIFRTKYAHHPGVVPAQALTIQTQLTLGLLAGLGLLLTGWAA